jgi:hypothetical protein
MFIVSHRLKSLMKAKSQDNFALLREVARPGGTQRFRTLA